MSKIIHIDFKGIRSRKEREKKDRALTRIKNHIMDDDFMSHYARAAKEKFKR